MAWPSILSYTDLGSSSSQQWISLSSRGEIWMRCQEEEPQSPLLPLVSEPCLVLLSLFHYPFQSPLCRAWWLTYQFQANLHSQGVCGLGSCIFLRMGWQHVITHSHNGGGGIRRHLSVSPGLCHLGSFLPPCISSPLLPISSNYPYQDGDLSAHRMVLENKSRVPGWQS